MTREGDRAGLFTRRFLLQGAILAAASLVACGRDMPAPTPAPRRAAPAILLHSDYTGTPSEAETLVRDHLLRLFARYDLDRWRFTDRVVIEHGATPHSHPVLTLGTARAEDYALLSAYIHEQLHWYVAGFPPGQEDVQREMLARYPNLPVGSPQGSGSEASNRQHLLVCPLECMGMIALVGEAEARRVLGGFGFYTAIYAAVLRDWADIRALFARYRYGVA